MRTRSIALVLVVALVGLSLAAYAAKTTSISVTINATTTTVPTNRTLTFTATVKGTTNQAVTWSIQEGSAGGTISSSGLYTAPATAGIYHGERVCSLR